MENIDKSINKFMHKYKGTMEPTQKYYDEATNYFRMDNSEEWQIFEGEYGVDQSIDGVVTYFNLSDGQNDLRIMFVRGEYFGSDIYTARCGKNIQCEKVEALIDTYTSFLSGMISHGYLKSKERKNAD